MDHIPVEVLHLIFIQLELKDRLECMLVCKLWHDILDQRSLLRTLRVPYRLFHQFKDMIERRSYRGEQVEILEIEADDDVDKRKLCNLFPNLRQLKLIDCTTRFINHNDMSYESHFKHPSKLERLLDFGNCELARQLAISNLGGHLNLLELNFVSSDNTRIALAIPQLKNMPVLEHLRLADMKVKLSYLETIHCNLSSIRHLEFIGANILYDEVPRNVAHATLITKLYIEIEAVQDLLAHIQLYQYMASKYPSVNRLVIYDGVLKGGHDSYVKELYKKGVFPCYQAIGSHVDRFSFENYLDELDAFKKFDEYGIELKHLSIKSHSANELSFEALTQSNQANHIQHLDLENILPSPLIKLERMKALQTLKIAYDDLYVPTDEITEQQVDFSQFIEVCPATLAELSTLCVDLTFSNPPLNPTCINCLILRRINLTSSLARILETNFPKLSVLNISGTLTSNLTISLPNHNLKFVKISTYYPAGQRNGFLLKTTNDDKVQYYAQREIQYYRCDGRLCTGDRVIPVSKNEFDDPFVVTITCAFVKKVDFFAYCNIW